MFVPRGTWLKLDGRWFGCLGGAGSIDKATRLLYKMYWSPDEQITDDEVRRLLLTRPIGEPIRLLTHCPPQSVITKRFDNRPGGLLRRMKEWGVPPDWFDPSAHKIEAAWQELGCPPLYCGHMHETVQEGNVRILAVEEITFV
jgi:hypothetical protein